MSHQIQVFFSTLLYARNNTSKFFPKKARNFLNTFFFR